jgi:hypothetical protein
MLVEVHDDLVQTGVVQGGAHLAEPAAVGLDGGQAEEVLHRAGGQRPTVRLDHRQRNEAIGFDRQARHLHAVETRL